MTEVPHVVAVLGRGVVDPDAPIVTADDLGLTRGDGCFDSARVVTGATGVARVVDLDGHLRRLALSAAALDLEPPPEDALRALIAQALAAWSVPGEATLKLVLTRGREWHPAGPTAYLSITHRGAGSGGAGQVRSITAVTLSSGRPADAFAGAPWLLGGVKSLAYAVNVAALREARRRAAQDVIFVSTDGFALEGTTSALLVARDGMLLATPTGGTGVLESTSVARILRAAQADGAEGRFELIPAADLAGADGVWLVSSSRGPVLVTVLDGHELARDEALARRILGYAGF